MTEPLQPCDIPAARQGLRDNHSNLQRVAEYCESNYLQASDKRKALEETMAFSTQSLASVAYQVSSLATTFLQLLDLQAAELQKLEANVSCVAQSVDMHKEKVSRREIGSLTVSKRFPAHQKIISPPNPPFLEPYYRKPLNFSILDDVGHGIKDHSTQLSRTGTLSRKGIKIATQSAGTMGRSTRVPEPIQPPMIPEGKLSAASSASSLTSLSTPTSPRGPAPTAAGGPGRAPTRHQPSSPRRPRATAATTTGAAQLGGFHPPPTTTSCRGAPLCPRELPGQSGDPLPVHTAEGQRALLRARGSHLRHAEVLRRMVRRHPGRGSGFLPWQLRGALLSTRGSPAPHRPPSSAASRRRGLHFAFDSWLRPAGVLHGSALLLQPRHGPVPDAAACTPHIPPACSLHLSHSLLLFFLMTPAIAAAAAVV
ncbi:ABI gene family member 3 isoform X1 [Numida meleagris]|uniref:ABI gene family member 3 isoform X1 n=1 Tax=Numida meleagris TaxID=8996 RepID=UPI000B3DDF8A|nr:ABI gene family member 3 isoform X1 [Numida meleagris]XP_021233757.1 ABI gene family member 3 isoform X1 [Numida meleagris]XP_021233758.1 ABI gene family member 3 isoform X1 [Numida meleagris]